MHRLVRDTPFISQPGRTYCQVVTKAITVCNHFEQLQHEISIAEFQLQPSCIRFGNNTRFITLTGKSNGHTGSDGIHAITVADFVAFGDSFQICDVKVTSQGCYGLIFGTAIARIDAVFRMVESNAAFALNRTRMAAFTLI